MPIETPTDLNPGIVKVVTLLNELGFQTCDSGDGETHECECDRDVGYVVVTLSPSQDLEGSADYIAQLLESRGVRFGTGPDDVLISASYGPRDGMRLVDIHGIHDRMLTETD